MYTIENWISNNTKFQTEYHNKFPNGIKETDDLHIDRFYNITFVSSKDIYISHFNRYGSIEQRTLNYNLLDKTYRRILSNYSDGIKFLSKYNTNEIYNMMYSESNNAVKVRTKYKELFVLLKYSPFRVNKLPNGKYMYDCGGLYELLLYLILSHSDIPVYITKTIEL